jgi:hypothetical protein
MSGILNKKQRIMDFSLTRNGYEQTQNGDLRIKYATFTDKDAVYEASENTIDISDTSVMPFNFEIFNTYSDDISPEIDLNSYVFDSDINNNIRLSTDYDKSFIRVNNGYISSSIENLASVFDKIVNTVSSSLEKQSIILSDNFVNIDFSTKERSGVDIKISKINDEQTINSIESIIKLNNLNNNLLSNINNKNYFTMQDGNTFINDKSLIEDSRFINKLPYRFLPPDNMNIGAISKNDKIFNFYNMNEDKRDLSKIINKTIKNIVSSSIDVSELNTAIANNSDQSIIRSISNLEKLSSKRYNEIINDNRISTFELEFEKIEKDAPFIIQLYETNDTVSSINKLVCVDHGEIFSNEKNKFMQVFSFGKIFHTNIDVDIKYQLNNNSFNDDYINSDNYLFVNMFTIVLE